MAVNRVAPKTSKKELAKQLGVSRASLYYKPKQPAKDLKLKAEIDKVMAKHKAYGHRRVAIDLNINHKRAYCDQGSENCSQISMSKKASPWQNGYKESFYSEFKLELGHPECYPTLGELIEAIAKQIHYYNNERIHTALKCPPAVFAQKCALQKINKLTFQRITKVQSV